MKRIGFILSLIIFITGCSEKPKNYTVKLFAYAGYDNKIDQIQAQDDSSAYAQGLIALYGAKMASKQYKFDDKYKYVEVKNEQGESLETVLGMQTKDNIKKKLGEIPHLKKIQEEIESLPEI